MNRKTNRKTIVFALHRGFSIRLLLKTKILEKLKGNEYKIILLLPSLQDSEYWRNEFGKDVIIEKLKYNEMEKMFRGRLHTNFRLIRYITYRRTFFKKLGTNKYHIKTMWHDIQLNFIDSNSIKKYKGYLRLMFIISTAWILSRVKIFRSIFVWIEGKIFNSHLHEHLFSMYKPDLLIVPSLGYYIDAFVMREAKNYKIPILSIIQSWDNVTSKGYGGCKSDYVITWNAINKTELIEHHDYKEKQIFIGGVPHWDDYFQENSKISFSSFAKKYNIGKDYKVITFVSASIKLYRNNLNVLESILTKVKEGFYGHKCVIIFRPHPSYFTMSEERWSKLYIDYQDKIKKLKKLYPKVLMISNPGVVAKGKLFDIKYSNQIDIKELLVFSDVMVNVYSTMMIEASIFDLPAVNIAFGNYRNTNYKFSIYDEFDHIKPINEINAIKNAYSEEELHTSIKIFLANKKLYTKERKILVDKMLPNQGKAATTIARQIEQICMSHHQV